MFVQRGVQSDWRCGAQSSGRPKSTSAYDVVSWDYNVLFVRSSDNDHVAARTSSSTAASLMRVTRAANAKPRCRHSMS